MPIRLTTPKAFDRLIKYLEKEQHLEWPELQTTETYRDWFIRETKKAMKKDTVFLNVDWEYDADRQRVTCSVSRMLLSEITTDEDYIKDDENGNN